HPLHPSLFPYTTLFRSTDVCHASVFKLGSVFAGIGFLFLSGALALKNCLFGLYPLRSVCLTRLLVLLLCSCCHYLPSLVNVLSRSEEHTSELQSQSNIV